MTMQQQHTICGNIHPSKKHHLVRSCRIITEKKRCTKPRFPGLWDINHRGSIAHRPLKKLIGLGSMGRLYGAEAHIGHQHLGLLHPKHDFGQDLWGEGFGGLVEGGIMGRKVPPRVRASTV